MLVGSVASTFSFAAHARGLAQPFYSTYDEHGLGACVKAPGTEAGMLFGGPMPTYCTCTEAGLFPHCDFVCGAVHQRCISSWALYSKLGGRCIQDIISCHQNLNPNWHASYTAHAELMNRFSANWYARHLRKTANAAKNTSLNDDMHPSARVNLSDGPMLVAYRNVGPDTHLSNQAEIVSILKPQVTHQCAGHHCRGSR